MTGLALIGGLPGLRSSWRPPALRATGRLLEALSGRAVPRAIVERASWAHRFGGRVAAGPWTRLDLDPAWIGPGDAPVPAGPLAPLPLSAAPVVGPFNGARLSGPAARAAFPPPPAMAPLRLRSLRMRTADGDGAARRDPYPPVILAPRHTERRTVSPGDLTHARPETRSFVPLVRTAVDRDQGLGPPAPDGRPDAPILLHRAAWEPGAPDRFLPPSAHPMADDPIRPARPPMLTGTADWFDSPEEQRGVRIRLVPPLEARAERIGPDEARREGDQEPPPAPPPASSGRPDPIDMDSIIERVSATLARRDLLERERRGRY